MIGTDMTKFEQIAEIEIYRHRTENIWHLWLGNTQYICSSFERVLTIIKERIRVAPLP